MSKRRTTNRRRGAAALEGAIVLGALFVLLLGMFELSLAVLEYNTLSLAARHLARTAAVHGQRASPQATSWGPQTLETTADQNGEAAAAVRSVAIVLKPSHVRIKLQWLDADHDYDRRVRASISYRHQGVLPWFPSLLGGEMQATSTMRVAH